MNSTYICRTRGLPAHISFWILALVLFAAVSAPGATQQVRMVNFAFQPKSLTNNVGDTVVWTNTTTTGHNVVSEDAAWDPPALFTRPGTFSVTFTQPGVYNYFCSPHRSFGMTGTIVVQAAANQPPVIALTNPPPGLVLTAPGSVSLGAQATDPDGTVASVEFFDGATSLGNVNSQPYTMNVTNLAEGTHNFTAKAIDNLGLSATSAAVAVSVISPAPALMSFDPNIQIVNGQLPLRVTVTPGFNYAIESTSDFATWQTFTNFTASSSLMEFLVPVNTGESRLYRGKLLPNP